MIFNIKDGTESGKKWGSANNDKYGTDRPILKCLIEHPNFGKYDVKFNINEEVETIDGLPNKYSIVSSFSSYKNTFPIQHVNVYKDGKDVFNSFDLDNTICLTWEASEDELQKLRPNSAADDLELNNEWIAYKKNNDNATYYNVLPTAFLNNSYYWNGPTSPVIIEPTQSATNLNNVSSVNISNQNLKGIVLNKTDLNNYSSFNIYYYTSINYFGKKIYTTSDNIEFPETNSFAGCYNHIPFYTLYGNYENNDIERLNNNNPVFKSSLQKSQANDMTYIPLCTTSTENPNGVIQNKNFPELYEYTKDDLINARWLRILDFNRYENYDEDKKTISPLSYSGTGNVAQIFETSYHKRWPDIQNDTYLSSYLTKYPSLKEFLTSDDCKIYVNSSYNPDNEHNQLHHSNFTLYTTATIQDTIIDSATDESTTATIVKHYATSETNANVYQGSADVVNLPLKYNDIKYDNENYPKRILSLPFSKNIITLCKSKDYDINEITTKQIYINYPLFNWNQYHNENEPYPMITKLQMFIQFNEK